MCIRDRDTRKQGGRGKVNCVEGGEDDEYAFTVGLGKTWDRSGSEIVDLQVGGVILNGVLIDSESSCNIIDQKTWEELKQKGIKCKSERQIRNCVLMELQNHWTHWESSKHQ